MAWEISGSRPGAAACMGGGWLGPLRRLGLRGGQARVATLARHAEETGEVVLFPVMADQGACLRRQLVPKRSVGAGAEGGAAGNPRAFLVGLARSLGGLLGGVSQALDQPLQQKKPRMNGCTHGRLS